MTMQDISPNLKVGCWCETCQEYCYFDPKPSPPDTRWRKAGRFVAAVSVVVGSVVAILLASIGATAVTGFLFLYYS